MRTIDWSPKSDEFLKAKEIEIHEIYHQNLANKEIAQQRLLGQHKRIERIKYLNKAIENIGHPIGGRVLEVGAGDGWCSAYMINQFPAINELNIMEVNRPAVEQLIPKSIASVNGDLSKVVTILGSFNNIRFQNEMDFIIAMGALHHSGNLGLTFKSMYQALKPGGWLIAQEPYMLDETPNTFYFERDEEVIQFKNLVGVTNSERSDTFYRLCEYKTAAYHAGFDFQYESFDNSLTIKNVIKKLIGRTLPLNKPRNMVVFCQKPFKRFDLKPITAW